MTTTCHCDKLCLCDTCSPIRWALKLATQDLRQAEVFVQYPPQTGDTGELRFEYEAMCAILDPAKLAELYVLALRARGFGDGEHVRITHWEHPITKKPMIGIWWRSECVNADCDMSTARAKLLAIMNADPDESSREACEQILRGEP